MSIADVLQKELCPFLYPVTGRQRETTGSGPSKERSRGRIMMDLYNSGICTGPKDIRDSGSGAIRYLNGIWIGCNRAKGRSLQRSEERRVGKECRSRLRPHPLRKSVDS